MISQNSSSIFSNKENSEPCADRKVIELYMKNQLELNSEEFEHYERMINELIRKLEISESQFDTFRKSQSNQLLEMEACRSELQTCKTDLELQTVATAAWEEKVNRLTKF